MLKTSLTHNLELELRLKQEELHGRQPYPDSEPRVHLLLRFMQWLRGPNGCSIRSAMPAPSRSDEQELLVPDDYVALLIHEGMPVKSCWPGRHRLPAVSGRIKVRLVPQESLPQLALECFPHDLPPGLLRLVQGLPYERALLFVDGAQVAVVKPARASQARPAPRQIMPAARILASRPLPEAGADVDEDHVPGFSFV